MTTATKTAPSTTLTKISKFKAFELIKSAGSKIFTVTFIKKGGELRVMNCRRGVTKGISDNPAKKVVTNNDDTNYIMRVYDVKKEGYRNINLNGMTELKINKQIFQVV